MVNQEARLRPGDALPPFELPEGGGRRIHVGDYRGRRNLVLFFVDSMDCRKCQEVLQLLNTAFDEIIAEETQLLIIMPASADSAREFKESLGLRFPVLADSSGSVFRRYGVVGESGELLLAVFISDRFGELYHVAIARGEHELPSAKEILGWLSFIEIQCPECGAPEWPRY